jgi:hypothetical protein
MPDTAPDTKIESALGQLIERCPLLRHSDRIVEGQHGGAGTKPDALGASRKIGEEREVGREQPAMADEMVFDNPGVIDTDSVGKLDLLDDAAIVRLSVANGGQIGRQIEQPELHGMPPVRSGPIVVPGAAGLAVRRRSDRDDLIAGTSWPPRAARRSRP